MQFKMKNFVTMIVDTLAQGEYDSIVDLKCL